MRMKREVMVFRLGNLAVRVPHTTRPTRTPPSLNYAQLYKYSNPSYVNDIVIMGVASVM